jgi:tripartite-type tricarboxylate transporter receptor subunit TctC
MRPPIVAFPGLPRLHDHDTADRFRDKRVLLNRLHRMAIPCTIALSARSGPTNHDREEAMRAGTLATLITALLLPLPAAAQDWPTRPVTMVVPFAAGGQVDVLGRLVAAGLSEVLGQQVVVENVGGAGGMIGANRVAKAAPDGYQMLMGSVSNLAQGQSLYKAPLYNAQTEFTPVALIGEAPLVLATRKDLPAANLQEFISYGKANGDKMQYGSAGSGSATHLGCVLLNLSAGIKTTHVPYRGGGPAMQDMIAGRIDYSCNVIVSALSQIRSGHIKAIAMLSRDRAVALPDLATAHEQGLQDFDVGTWNAIMMPAKTPPAIVAKLNEAIGKVLANPAHASRAEGAGVTFIAPARRSTEYLAKFHRDEIEKWARTSKEAGIAGTM